MAESTTAALPEESSARLSVKFPVLWTLTLALVAGGLYFLGTDVDPGVKNTVVFIAIYFSAFGVALWAWLRSGLTAGRRWLWTFLPLLVVYSFSALGPIKLILDGDVGLMGWRWRWLAQPDERLAVPTMAETIDQWQTTPSDYPRFLGAGYWAEVKGVALETDWQAHPPRELWRQDIGAGWSSFAVVGSYAVTQEQRGEQELVTCYKLATGEIVWTHADPVRWDPGGTGALGYAGPRATPTIAEGKIFVHGATGILNCLDARTGKVLWSHDTLAKHSAENVNWGKAGSPLVYDDLVVVSVGGKNDQSLVAYRTGSGEVAWASGKYQSSYASPVLAEVAGVRQVISVDEGYATGRRADDGAPLWQHAWDSESGSAAAASQPVPLPGDRLFLSKGYGHGASLLQLSVNSDGQWQADPLWGVFPVMKTKMGNVLVHGGYVYGIDDVNLQCIELATGKKQWKKRRRPKFGHGQIMLVGDTLLILTELGELVLAEATPDKYRELASLQMLDADQITWNNPAFAPPYLLVRNAEEAVCYELPMKPSGTEQVASKASGKWAYTSTQH